MGSAVERDLLGLLGQMTLDEKASTSAAQAAEQPVTDCAHRLAV